MIFLGRKTEAIFKNCNLKTIPESISTGIIEEAVEYNNISNDDDEEPPQFLFDSSNHNSFSQLNYKTEVEDNKQEVLKKSSNQEDFDNSSNNSSKEFRKYCFRKSQKKNQEADKASNKNETSEISSQPFQKLESDSDTTSTTMS